MISIRINFHFIDLTKVTNIFLDSLFGILLLSKCDEPSQRLHVLFMVTHNVSILYIIYNIIVKIIFMDNEQKN